MRAIENQDTTERYANDSEDLHMCYAFDSDSSEARFAP